MKRNDCKMDKIKIQVAACCSVVVKSPIHKSKSLSSHHSSSPSPSPSHLRRVQVKSESQVFMYSSSWIYVLKCSCSSTLLVSCHVILICLLNCCEASLATIILLKRCYTNIKLITNININYYYYYYHHQG